MEFDRAFTVPQANGLLPRVEAVLGRLDAPRARLEGHMGKIQVLDVLWGPRIRDPANPDRAEFLEERAGLRGALRSIEAVVEEELLPLGVRFPPGGLEHGLVDFPSTLDGRWVLLCWRRGEPEVRWWHELGGGFAGRRALDPGTAARMGVEPLPPPPM